MAKRRENVILFPGVEVAPRADHVDAVIDAFGESLKTFVIIGTGPNGKPYVNVPLDLTIEDARSLWQASLSELEALAKPKKPGGRGGKKT